MTGGRRDTSKSLSPECDRARWRVTEMGKAGRSVMRKTLSMAVDRLRLGNKALAERYGGISTSHCKILVTL